MKLVRIVGKVLLGLMLLVVALYLVGVAINWRDQPPSAAALRMQALLDEGASLPDAQNGFVYLMGFAAAQNADVQEVGTRRVAWLKALNNGTDKVFGDPAPVATQINAYSSASMSQLRKACGEAQSGKCREAFEAAGLQSRNPAETLQLARYRELLKRENWHDVVPQTLHVVLPPYAEMLNGQRLFMVDLGRRANSASAADIRDALDADMRFWRRMLASSGYLISKMISVAGLRQHLYLGNLVLRQLPRDEALAALPQGWRQELTPEELSMERTMAGEWAYGAGIMREWQTSDELLGGSEPALTDTTFGGRLVSTLLRPFFQAQDQKNFTAAQYLSFARSFDVPLDRYRAAYDASRATGSSGFELRIYNFVGDLLRSITGSRAYPDYPMRVAAAEGMRRAALLTVELRSRGISKEAVAEQLAHAELRQPFDHAPFAWSADDQAVIYGGFETDQRRRSAYFY